MLHAPASDTWWKSGGGSGSSKPLAQGLTHTHTHENLPPAHRERGRLENSGQVINRREAWSDPLGSPEEKRCRSAP